MTTTLFPSLSVHRSAATAANEITDVVFPTPPFWLQNTITAIKSPVVFLCTSYFPWEPCNIPFGYIQVHANSWIAL